MTLEVSKFSSNLSKLINKSPILIAVYSHQCCMTACFYSCSRGDGEQLLCFQLAVISTCFTLQLIFGICLAFSQTYQSDEKQEYCGVERGPAQMFNPGLHLLTTKPPLCLLPTPSFKGSAPFLAKFGYYSQLTRSSRFPLSIKKSRLIDFSFVVYFVSPKQIFFSLVWTLFCNYPFGGRSSQK